MNSSTKKAASQTAHPDLLTNDEAAAYINVTPRTLEVWRCTNRYSLPYLKIGRLVRYRKADLDAWLERRTVHASDDDGVLV
ncbi:helix-turn-helix domain-containing protein [Cupriavidus oxalaticus]|uniref:DNA-binding protein n=1 Tax=Cupriavidus oxalaticus TaxID=96344 RepID=A0A5P3VRQ9_9BURK|nr:helix-turn-helix domain-containing protein [Cupriavidus oxalaticus]QEZ47469.1 DNA-binding protein [Cupriavidus oxalaticus]